MSIDPVLVVFLERTEGNKAGDKSFPGYYEYRYNRKPDKLLKKALKKGYLVESDYKFNMYQTTNANLKDILREYDLKVSGVKDELVKRLLKNIDEEELKSIFDQSYYQLSDSGKKLVENNQHVIYYHKKLDKAEISLKEYHETYITEELNKYEVAIKLIRKKSKKYRKEGDWGLYRNTFLSMGDVYADSGNNKKALELYLKIYHLDLSGLSNNNAYMPSTIFLAPGIIGRIEQEMSNLNYDKNKVKEVYFYVAKKLDLPKTVYSKEKSFNYILKAMDEGTEAIEEELKGKKDKSTIERLSEEKQITNKSQSSGNNSGSGCLSVILFSIIFVLVVLYKF